MSKYAEDARQAQEEALAQADEMREKAMYMYAEELEAEAQGHAAVAYRAESEGC